MMDTRFSSAVLALMITMGICAILLLVTEDEPPKEQKTNPCKCPTIEETLHYYERYIMFLDKLEHAPKSKRPPLQDSVNKYLNIIRP